MHYAVEDLCAGLTCHWGVWIKPPAFWAIFPEVPPCGGKEPHDMSVRAGLSLYQCMVNCLEETYPPLTRSHLEAELSELRYAEESAKEVLQSEAV